MRQLPWPAWRPLVVVLAAVGVVLGVTAVYGRANGIPLREFTRDPITTLYGAFWHGYLSGVGVLLVWGSAVVCGVTAYALRQAGDMRGASPFLYLAIFLSVFALDDLFLIHDEVLPKVHLTHALQLGYVVGAIAFVFLYRDFVRSSDRMMAILALALLAGSLAHDTLSLGMYFVEDSFKLLGIAVGTLYVVRECLKRMPTPACAHTDPAHAEGSSRTIAPAAKSR